MKKVERINIIMRYINNRAHFTISEIMQEFTISRSTAIRDIREIVSKIIEQANESEINTVLCDGINELMAVEKDQTDENNGDITASLVDLFDDCEKDFGDIVGIPSGFSHLDRLTGGFQE